MTRLLAALLIPLLTVPAFAHKVTTVSVVTEIDTKKQTYAVNMAMDVESSGDAEIDDEIPPEQAARTFAEEALIVYFDELEIKKHTIQSKIITTSDEDTPEELKRMSANVILSGKIPKGAENFLLYVSDTTEASVVMIFKKDGKPGRRLQVLYPGDFSRPNNILPIAEGDPFKKAEQKKNAVKNIETSPATGFLTALKKGFATIFPDGTTHWVFVIGFLLLSLRKRAITIQVAAFITAHSLGLALTSFEIMAVPGTITTLIIGLGIFYIGLENLILTELKPWRPPIIFIVGLFHGFAFSEHHSTTGFVELIGFNLGIELAIIAILMVGLLLLITLIKQDWYRKIIIIPASALLVVAGLYWACLPFI